MKCRKRIAAWIICILCAVSANAQDKKINFQDLTWDEAMKVAAKEKKFIFVDAYRDPCESCDKAFTTVFATDSVAELYSANFVNIRINMNSEEGRAFAPKLQMLMYPAYIFFSADGEQLGSSNAYNFVNDYGQAMYQANLAITQGNIRLNNSRHIQFEEELSWKDVLAKSKKENKPIFVDAYTTWCRPCIQMDRNVFTLNEVADFYNDNFINVKLNAEKGEGNEIREKFNIRAYPTYLYLDSNGELVSSMSGYTEATPFIDYGKEALKKYTEEHGATGIQFQEGSWQDILKKSKAENKLIFFDAYTTWCGPCKMMAKNVFTNDTVANFFNENFINVKFDMEKGEGIDLKEKFEVAAYPTYVYVDGDGNPVHRTVGSTTVSKFVEHGKNALSDENNLASLEKKYADGTRDPIFIEQYLAALKEAYLSKKMGEVASQYLDGIKKKDLQKENNWTILKDYLTDAQSDAFSYLVKNRTKFYKLYDEKDVDNKIYYTYIRGGNRFVTTDSDKSAHFDQEGFDEYLATIEQSGVNKKEQIKTYIIINNLYSRQQWEEYVERVDEGLENGNIQKTPINLYNYALTIKRVGENPEQFTRGAAWAKIGGDVEKNKEYSATYYNLQAELLEKAGKPDEAEAARNNYQQDDLEKAKEKNPMKELIIKKN